LAAPLSLRLRGKLLAIAFTCPAQKGTSAGLTRAGVSVCAPASLSGSAGILSFVNALFCLYYLLITRDVKFCSYLAAKKKAACAIAQWAALFAIRLVVYWT
jgi:hypothetical protein